MFLSSEYIQNVRKSNKVFRFILTINAGIFFKNKYLNPAALESQKQKPVEFPYMSWVFDEKENENAKGNGNENGREN